ncbi:MAG: CPXCG motif-containing cysteine-rich protein [Ignavibacteriales bacterium]|nr:CPXCG motif-containing cysteine-rich protein [Ignavibacteriales bacterium]MBI3787152.1 CPXCG motif-containing cysteine-rich protein [Ignavibacteriales bacterium]
MNDGLCTYFCAYCGEGNETSVEVSAGNRQSYVEDCAVCCRPNVLTISIDGETGAITIDAEFEG